MDTLASINELFPSTSPASAAKANSVEDMGSDDFLTLMVAQLENQDPTKPMDNMAFMSQLAQFKTPSGDWMTGEPTGESEITTVQLQVPPRISGP